MGGGGSLRGGGGSLRGGGGSLRGGGGSTLSLRVTASSSSLSISSANSKLYIFTLVPNFEPNPCELPPNP